MELGVTLGDLAEDLGVSEAGIRQARLDPAASGYRSPPEGWPAAVARLARRRARELEELADGLQQR